jgi:uncharacterized glyoxalase superfamily protein PhnB
MTSAKPVPDGMHTVTPHLVITGAAQAIKFYEKAFGATTLGVAEGPGGMVMHAGLRIGDSVIFLADEMGEGCQASPQKLGGSAVTLHLYVDDADEWFRRAVAAGAEAVMPMMDAFWGDRYGVVKDPYGHSWAIATHVEDLTPEQIKQRQEEFFAQMAK